MTPTNCCPTCHTPLLPDAPAGLCPACLMQQGLQFEVNSTISLTSICQGPLTGTSADSLEPGQCFGEYRIEGELGRGGMGIVYAAVQESTGRPVALKILRSRLASPEHRSRFFQEGRLAASCNHPNSVYIFGSGEVNEHPVIVMERVRGGTLQDRLDRDGPLPVGRAVDAILDLIAGLESAQAAGILHRDIKPSNCFAEEDGTVKIGDFGLSISTRGVERLPGEPEGSFQGTPAFASPEQCRGEPLLVTSDIYAVGATLFSLLSGEAPFSGRSISAIFNRVFHDSPPDICEIRPDVPAQLTAAVVRCLCKIPGERFQSYADLREALAPFGSDAPEPARLGLRGIAGLVDEYWPALFSVPYALLAKPFSHEHFSSMAEMSRASVEVYAWPWALWAACFIGNRILLEGLYGATIGKAICGIRVIDEHRNPPGLQKAIIRSLLFAFPLFLMSLNPFLFRRSSIPGVLPEYTYIVTTYLFLGLFILLFVTMRRRNGFAAVHDCLTNTRVIHKPASIARPTLARRYHGTPTEAQCETRLGPYKVLGAIPGDTEWSEGYDPCLMRSIWIRWRGRGETAVSESLRSVGRPGRLRWLMGARSEQENWDSYEALTGAPFLRIAQIRQPWAHVRLWLLDLVEELKAANGDGTTPARFSLDRIWITADGRAKLLDERAPGLDEPDHAAVHPREWMFLKEVARAALGEAPSATNKGGLSCLESRHTQGIAAPVPLHAQKWLQNLETHGDLSATTRELKSLLRRPTMLRPARRLALVASYLVFPLFMACGFITLQKNREPLLAHFETTLEIKSLLFKRRSHQRWRKEPHWSQFQSDLVTDRQFAVYISRQYGSFVRDPQAWSGLWAQTLLREERQYVEGCVRDVPNPTDTEYDAVVKKLDGHPRLPSQVVLILRILDAPILPSAVFWCVLAACMGGIEIVTSLLLGNGAILSVLGMAVARRDGHPASRVRVLTRALLAWLPVFGFASLMIGAVLLQGGQPMAGSVPVGMVLVGMLWAVWSILRPLTYPPNLLSGTRLLAK